MRVAALSVLMVVAGAVGLATVPARAGLITESFQFQHQSNLGNTVSGSFTFDTTLNPSSRGGNVTSLVVNDGPLVTVTSDRPTGIGIGFDGTSLKGFTTAAAIDFPFVIRAPTRFTGSSSGTTGSITFTAYFLGFLPVGSDRVSGDVTITAVPEPSTIVSCGTAGIMGLVYARRRRRPALG